VLFLVVLPLALGWLLAPLAALVPGNVSRGAAVGLGAGFCAAGLLLLLWATVTFWRAGGGTPVPVAAPQRLVVAGPFLYSRNPIMLGAVLYFLGAGSLWLSPAAGLLIALVALALGAVYHRFVEEKELRLRFGAAYDEYRRTTPFLIPRRPRAECQKSTSDPV
jgi:protein-S-isoprenylcysteine O-methyltransferase Ste14